MLDDDVEPASLATSTTPPISRCCEEWAGACVVIDLYNRSQIETLPLVESYERGGRKVESTRSWNGARHRVELRYADGSSDEVEFRLYTPGEFAELTRAAGLRVSLACAWFSESLAPSAEHARMQFVLERG